MFQPKLTRLVLAPVCTLLVLILIAECRSDPLGQKRSGTKSKIADESQPALVLAKTFRDEVIPQPDPANPDPDEVAALTFRILDPGHPDDPRKGVLNGLPDGQFIVVCTLTTPVLVKMVREPRLSDSRSAKCLCLKLKAVPISTCTS